MEMLNSFSMILKSDLWTKLIELFFRWITNYGWAIIVFTIALKLLMSPLDIIQRNASQKQAKVMGVLQPELDKLKQKYGNDPTRLNQETNNLYRRYGVNLGGMCLPMLLTMVLSLVIVFTLYGSVRKLGNEKIYSGYQQLDKTYIEVSAGQSVDELTADEKIVVQTKLKEEYKAIKKENGWLWVKNIWKSDTKTSQFVDYDKYVEHFNIADTEEEREKYEFITSSVTDGKKDVNGYYVLIILTAGISFLSQFISAKLLSPKGQKLSGMNLVMLFVIPITMLILAATSNVLYTLYIITNSLMATIISTIISIIMKRRYKDENILLSKKNVQVVEYSRNFRK